jgi:hypothetical protein
MDWIGCAIYNIYISAIGGVTNYAIGNESKTKVIVLD